MALEGDDMWMPIGSFPDERWAHEIVGLLKKSGFKASIVNRGPRAYQVVVPESEAGAAGESLAALGYFTCPVRQSSRRKK